MTPRPRRTYTDDFKNQMVLLYQNGKRVVVFKKGKFVQAFGSAAEAAEALGMKADAVQTIARGERRPPKGFRIECIESEVH